VDHRIEAAETVNLVSNMARAVDGGQISHHNSIGLWQGATGSLATLVIAGVEHDAMTLLDQELASHKAESG
jgi:hypothetical protein